MNTVTLKIRDAVAWLELNRPAELNAICIEMLRDLDAALETVMADCKARCLVVTGAGEKAFAAGADVGSMVEMSAAEAEWFSGLGCDVFEHLAALPIPVIAAINGYALGGGLELAMACDIRLAADTAVLGLPETTLGIMPGWDGTVRLATIAGYANACDLVFTGRKIGADEAMRMGIVNQVFPKGELEKEAEALARQICANAPLGVRKAKKSMSSRTDRMERATLFGELFLSMDQKTGMRNFCSKQKTEYFAGE